MKYYTENGSLQYSVDYKYIILDGKTIEYSTTRQVIKEIDYINGQIIK